jgi:hypothetical protein
VSAERDLDKMLADLEPSLLPGEFVFCSMPGASYGDFAGLTPLASMQEVEGLSLVLPRAAADSEGVGYSSVYRCISLGVHSSLEAVGLTAAIASRLAELGISANVIAGCIHDHVLVPAGRADEVLVALAPVDA